VITAFIHPILSPLAFRISRLPIGKILTSLAFLSTAWMMIPILPQPGIQFKLGLSLMELANLVSLQLIQKGNANNRVLMEFTPQESILASVKIPLQVKLSDRCVIFFKKTISSSSSSLEAVYCQTTRFGNATFNEVQSEGKGSVTCDYGFYSSDPTAYCFQNQSTAFWGNISEPCLPVYCPEDNSDPFALWPSVQAGFLSQGTCKPGYYSANPQRQCVQSESDGNWATITDPCQRLPSSLNKRFFFFFFSIDHPHVPFYPLAIRCETEQMENATFEETLSETTGIVTCDYGFYSTNATAYCYQNVSTAYWGKANEPCLPVYCPSDDSDSLAFWPTIQAGFASPGACRSSYYSPNPERECLQSGPDGVWGSITDPCQGFSFHLFSLPHLLKLNN